ncbi:MAG TPA: periplasmic heavy metal sensor [Dongiaceae bacterium]|jgi:uncharacterized membrane protein
MVNQTLPSNGPSNGPGNGMERKSSRRWVTIFLFLSLVANVFLAGLLAGRFLHHGDWFGGQPAYVQQMGPFAGHALQRLLEPLDDSDRQIVLDTVKSHADELMQINREIREQRKLVAQLLKADNYDRKALNDAFAELRRRTDSMQETLQAAVGDAVGKLSPTARKQLED